MRILGISAYFHDSAAALIEDGRIIAAAQEERFSRKKHDSSFPRAAAAYCLSRASGPVDAVVYYEKPLLKFERILTTALAVAPRGFGAFTAAIPMWITEKLWLRSVLADELATLGCGQVALKFASHHQSHAASAFFPSPFKSAAILTLDGVGEWATTTLGRGEGNKLELLSELRFPHSLGLLYSAFTHHCGFRVNSGEYKLMGLAPYGEPRYAHLIREKLLDLKADGSFRLDLSYFGYLYGETMTSPRFAQLFGVAQRKPEEPMTQAQCDLARSIQEVTEDIVLRLAHTLHQQTGETNLCMAGGVALNCVANARLLRDGPFKAIWIQPAAGDAGAALGAALALYHCGHDAPREISASGDAMQGAFLGPEFDDEVIASALTERGLLAHAQKLPALALHEQIAERLNAGDVVGYFQGRAEYGPRALGARSILADARSPEMQRRLNLKIKFRESFRPFAPIVLAERAAEWFELVQASPYMLLTAPVAQSRRVVSVGDGSWQQRLQVVRSLVPAVTHVDFSARVQTVDADGNARLHAVVSAFDRLTGCPVLVNTSFNVRGEPPVGHPRDAVDGFLATEMDALAIGSFLIEKRHLPADYTRPTAAARTFLPD